MSRVWHSNRLSFEGLHVCNRRTARLVVWNLTLQFEVYELFLDWALALPRPSSRTYRSVSCTKLNYVDLRMMYLIAWLLWGWYNPREVDLSIRLSPFQLINNLRIRRPLTISVRQIHQYSSSRWGAYIMSLAASERMYSGIDCRCSAEKSWWKFAFIRTN